MPLIIILEQSPFSSLLLSSVSLLLPPSVPAQRLPGKSDAVSMIFFFFFLLLLTTILGPYNTYQDIIMLIIRVDTLGIDPMAPCLCNRLIICQPVFNNNC